MSGVLGGAARYHAQGERKDDSRERRNVSRQFATAIRDRRNRRLGALFQEEWNRRVERRTKIQPTDHPRNQIATIVYDATYWLCERFLEPRSRMSDQMIQAARSGRRNIAEGSRAAATSSQTELRLVNVARSSQEELLLDFEDFLRHRRLRQWAPDARRWFFAPIRSPFRDATEAISTS
jgi:four helix bundle protein